MLKFVIPFTKIAVQIDHWGLEFTTDHRCAAFSWLKGPDGHRAGLSLERRADGNGQWSTVIHPRETPDSPWGPWRRTAAKYGW